MDEGVELVQQFFRDLTLPTWPVHGLAGTPGGWLSHASGEAGFATPERQQLESLTVSYASPTGHRRLLVQSQPAGARHAPTPVTTLLDWVSSGDLDEEPPASGRRTSAGGEAVTVLVDDRPVDAEAHRSGDAGAVRCRVDDVWVTVLFRGPAIDEPVHLVRITDLTPLQQHRDVVVADLLSRFSD